MTVSYKTGYPIPLQVQKGEKLELRPEDREYPGWTFCADNRGSEGRVPDYVINISGGNITAAEDYSALEFNIVKGEELEFIEEYFGWIKCRRDNITGWIPAGNCIIITSENRK